ncbi:hypothetical protein C0Q70_18701 [Pomacea canaliculata]|uniref:Uncharacterized protein n=1 Tax=Pomacea canaliculata TaxID=400727 RepID=A0A2T7NHB6_POMCA|nr:hypothetical protein C0Q70_18701 [Pomacea canaliculata]
MCKKRQSAKSRGDEWRGNGGDSGARFKVVEAVDRKHSQRQPLSPSYSHAAPQAKERPPSFRIPVLNHEACPVFSTQST